MTLDDAMKLAHEVSAHGQRWQVAQINGSLPYSNQCAITVRYAVRRANTNSPDVEADLTIREYQPFEEILAGMRG